MRTSDLPTISIMGKLKKIDSTAKITHFFSRNCVCLWTLLAGWLTTMRMFAHRQRLIRTYNIHQSNATDTMNAKKKRPCVAPVFLACIVKVASVRCSVSLAARTGLFDEYEYTRVTDSLSFAINLLFLHGMVGRGIPIASRRRIEGMLDTIDWWLAEIC